MTRRSIEKKPDQECLRNLYHNDGLTDVQIAKEFGVAQATVSRWRRELGISTFSRLERFAENCPIPNLIQEQIILGTLLGDASVSVPCDRKSNRRAILEVSHSTNVEGFDQTKYVFWLAKQLTGICYPPVSIKNGKQARIRSLASDYFSELRLLLYPHGKKVITAKFLSMLTPIAIAIWYMDDGTAQSSDSCRLCTHGFSRSENMLLADWLKTKFGISARIGRDRQYFFLSFCQSEARRLRKLIRPFVPSCMAYKMGSMNFDMSIYLSGSIDDAIDGGLPWRQEFRNALAVVGIDAIIPNDFGVNDFDGNLGVLKTQDDLAEFKQTFRKHIIRPDLAAMDACDMVVVRWDCEAIAGTAHECGRAFMRGQPVLLVTPRPFIEVPNWLLACCDKEFHTIDELVEYLRTRKTRKVKGAGE